MLEKALRVSLLCLFAFCRTSRRLRHCDMLPILHSCYRTSGFFLDKEISSTAMT
jgi:hypothetical protein